MGELGHSPIGEDALLNGTFSCDARGVSSAIFSYNH